MQVLRRSQSEGPHQRAAGPGGVAALEPGPMAAWVHGRRRHVTEQQRPEHWLVPSVRLAHPPTNNKSINSIHVLKSKQNKYPASTTRNIV